MGGDSTSGGIDSMVDLAYATSHFLAIPLRLPPGTTLNARFTESAMNGSRTSARLALGQTRAVLCLYKKDDPGCVGRFSPSAKKTLVGHLGPLAAVSIAKAEQHGSLKQDAVRRRSLMAEVSSRLARGSESEGSAGDVTPDPADVFNAFGD